MGQRLVIQIEDGNGTRLANAYYHWSAYTGSAAELTNQVLAWLDSADSNLTKKQKAAWALYKTGARFNPIEEQNLIQENMKKDYNFAFDCVEVNRNSGLLCVTESGMDQNVVWEESRVNIYPDSNEIYFDTIIEFTTDEYIKMKEEYENFWVPIDKLPTLSVRDHLEFTRNEWDSFYSQLMRLLQTNHAFAISPDQKSVYEFIQ